MKTTSLLLILPALILAGCSTAVSPAKSAKIDPQKTGLVLATLHRTGEKYTWVEFMLHQVDGRESSFTNLAIDSTKELTLIEVPVGRYQIADWTVTDGAQLTGPGTQYATKAFEFDVRPGEVTYLGHFEVSVKEESYFSSHWRFPRARPVLEDHSAQAIAAFRQQYPALTAVPVRSVAPERVALIPAPVGRYAWFGPDYSGSAYSYYQPMPTAPKWP